MNCHKAAMFYIPGIAKGRLKGVKDDHRPPLITTLGFICQSLTLNP
jgi:hypothetical protein